MALVKLRRKDDPIERDVEKDLVDEGLSPMSPPDAYAPPGEGLEVADGDLHPFLLEIRAEHRRLSSHIDAFEEALKTMQEHGVDSRANRALAAFFEAVDEEFIPHNRCEERGLFPVLARRLIDKGEHSRGRELTTAVDVLEDDHVQVIQRSALAYNFFALSCRLPDANSGLVVLDAAMQQAKALVELLRLHLFREDNVVVPLAHIHLTPPDLDALHAEAQRARQPASHEHEHEHEHHDHPDQRALTTS